MKWVLLDHDESHNTWHILIRSLIHYSLLLTCSRFPTFLFHCLALIAESHSIKGTPPWILTRSSMWGWMGRKLLQSKSSTSDTRWTLKTHLPNESPQCNTFVFFRSDIMSLLKTYNCYHEGKSFQLRTREVCNISESDNCGSGSNLLCVLVGD